MKSPAWVEERGGLDYAKQPTIKSKCPRGFMFHSKNVFKIFICYDDIIFYCNTY